MTWSGMLTTPAGNEAKDETRKSEDDAEARKFFSRPRPRPDTLENNSVKTKILAFRT